MTITISHLQPIIAILAGLLILVAPRLLNYIVPDVVHVLSDGRIVRSGGRELALELEEKGYGWVEPAAAGARK